MFDWNLSHNAAQTILLANLKQVGAILLFILLQVLMSSRVEILIFVLGGFLLNSLSVNVIVLILERLARIDLRFIDWVGWLKLCDDCIALLHRSLIRILIK